jgi:hypothetical protein
MRATKAVGRVAAEGLDHHVARLLHLRRRIQGST